MLNQQDLEFFKNNMNFWDKLSNSEIELLLENTACLTYHKGEIIHNAEQECIGVLLVKSGELRTYILSEDGKEITLYRLNRGEVCILSASCMLKNITFDVHIDAEQESEVLLINSIVFSQLIENNIYVENYSLRIAVDKFSDVMWTMEQILFMRFDKRLAIFLLDESTKLKSDDIPLTHEQIARYMGSAREVVSRMVKYFQSEGILATYRGGLKIINKAKLRQLL